MQRIIYFSKGPVSTPVELAEMASIDAAIAKKYELLRLNRVESAKFGYGNIATDFVAGSPPLDFADIPTFDPSQAGGGGVPAGIDKVLYVPLSGGELTIPNPAGLAYIINTVIKDDVIGPAATVINGELEGGDPDYSQLTITPNYKGPIFVALREIESENMTSYWLYVIVE